MVVLDSECVYWYSPKWQLLGTTAGAAGHRELWEQILWQSETAGDEAQMRRLPSHESGGSFASGFILTALLDMAATIPHQPPHPLCDIPSGCIFFTGPWAVTRSSLRVLRRVNAS